MKTERYIGVMAVLAIGMLLVNVAIAEDKTPAAPNYLQCYAPVNTLNVPAGAGVPGTVCTTYVPAAKAPAVAENQAPAAPNYLQCYAPVNTWQVPATSGPKAPARVVRPADTPLDVLGAILATPFVIAECILDGCP